MYPAKYPANNNGGNQYPAVYPAAGNSQYPTSGPSYPAPKSQYPAVGNSQYPAAGNSSQYPAAGNNSQFPPNLMGSYPSGYPVKTGYPAAANGTNYPAIQPGFGGKAGAEDWQPWMQQGQMSNYHEDVAFPPPQVYILSYTYLQLYAKIFVFEATRQTFQF